MVRRLVELVGVLVAGALVNTIIGLSQSQSFMTLQSWIVSAAIPLVLLIVYWLFIEPRNKRDRAERRRFRMAVEKVIEREYKLNPAHDISPQGLLLEGASDPYRKSRYQELEIDDLFVPDPRKGQKVLEARANEGDRLVASARRATAEGQGFPPQVKDELREWERLVGEDVGFYQRGPFRREQAVGFTKHSLTTQPNYELQLRRLERHISELRLYAKDQAKLARQRAERGDDS